MTSFSPRTSCWCRSKPAHRCPASACARPRTRQPTSASTSSFPTIGGIAHTHSRHATSWAQACREIPCYGTTHADSFYGPVPLCRPLTAEEIEDAYEWNTGVVIAEHFHSNGLDPLHQPGVLLPFHAPFAWGTSVAKAVENAVIMEEVAGLALRTEALNPKAATAPQAISDKHFLRKHGKDAYYGQPKG